MRGDRWGVRQGVSVAGRMREGGRAGQAGATWLEETDEDWVLEMAEAASSSPNGFFPQHTVVIMQFLNWRPETRENKRGREREGKASRSQSRHAFAGRQRWQRKRSCHSSSVSDNTLPVRLMDIWHGTQRQVKLAKCVSVSQKGTDWN